MKPPKPQRQKPLTAAQIEALQSLGDERWMFLPDTIAAALSSRGFVESKHVLRRTIVSNDGVQRQFALAYRRTAAGRQHLQALER
jgi:hypothetical protein